MNKVNWNRIGQVLLWIVSLGGLVALMGFIDQKKSEAVCKDVKIFMPGNQYFVERDEIDRILQTGSMTLRGRRMSNINIQELEHKLQANPFVEFAKVYMDMDGVIQVEVRQRVPILRVINKFGQDFYIDKKGLKLPLSGNFTARVLVANGDIDELFANRVDTLHSKITRDIYRTADFIRQDSLWDAQIEELYVNEHREIEMIPRVGEQRILLGNADSLESKFDNLLAFYTKAIPMVGWDAYKAINIKYANQVVGIRNPEAWKDSAKTRRRIPAPMMVASRQNAPTTAMATQSNEPFIAQAEVNGDAGGPKLVMSTAKAAKPRDEATQEADRKLADIINRAVREEADRASAKKTGENGTKKTEVKKAPEPAAMEKKEVKKASSPVPVTEKKDVKKAPEKTGVKTKTDNDVVIKPIILDPETKKSAEKSKSTSPNKKN